MLTLSSQLIRKSLIRKSNKGTKSLPFLRPNKGPASAENASDSRVLATHYICSFVYACHPTQINLKPCLLLLSYSEQEKSSLLPIYD